MIRSYINAVKYLEGFIPTSDKKHPGSLGLERMKLLMNLLGNPQNTYPTIHVGGTSGKGSTSTIIASILATKYKVGLHTSPHLIRINERVKVFQKLKAQSSKRKTITKNSKLKLLNVDISDHEFISLINKIQPYIRKMEKSRWGRPSYFEIVTAMAFLFFKKQKVDMAVIEVGMGGKFDATNVIKPLVAVLTNVGLDHTEVLGDTVEKIAVDKAGIIKPGIQVVTGARQPSVITIISAKCKAQSAKLSLLNRDFTFQISKTDEKGSVFDYFGNHTYKNLKLSLLGEHQVENAAIALRVIELSNYPIIQLSNNDIRKGLLDAFILGRLEIVSKKPTVILDGAHNPDKMKALVKAIKSIYPERRVISIVAIKEDKNAKKMLRQLFKISEMVIFTRFKIKGDVGVISSYDPGRLSKIAYQVTQQQRYTSRYTLVVKKMLAVNNIKLALKKAVSSAKPDGIILVTGSLYLVGEIRKFLIPNS